MSEFGQRLHQIVEASKIAHGVPTEVEFTNKIRERGFSSATLTQCNSISSLLKLLWQQHLNPRENFQVHRMTHEHAIVGMIAGIYLGSGERSLAISQNSGLANAGDGMVSFAENYEIPFGGVFTFRGLDEWSRPHNSWARRTVAVARAFMGGKHVYGSPLGRNILESFDKFADVVMDEDEPGQAILLLPKWATRESLPKTPPNKADTNYHPLDSEVRETKGTNLDDYQAREEMSQEEALADIAKDYPDALIIACNGNTARGLLWVKDRPNHFYNAAYMGGGKAIGYGAAISNPGLEVVVIDGDQNAQMGNHMYDILAEYYPPNLHIFTLNDGGASSVDASIPSPRLGHWHYEMTHVIRTRVQGITERPRVEEAIYNMLSLYNPQDAEILKKEFGELKYITKRVRRWMVQEGKDPVKVPAVFNEAIHI